MIPIFLTAMDCTVQVYVEIRDGVVSSPQFKIIITRVNTSNTISLSTNATQTGQNDPTPPPPLH